MIYNVWSKTQYSRKRLGNQIETSNFLNIFIILNSHATWRIFPTSLDFHFLHIFPTLRGGLWCTSVGPLAAVAAIFFPNAESVNSCLPYHDATAATAVVFSSAVHIFQKCCCKCVQIHRKHVNCTHMHDTCGICLVLHVLHCWSVAICAQSSQWGYMPNTDLSAFWGHRIIVFRVPLLRCRGDLEKGTYAGDCRGEEEFGEYAPQFLCFQWLEPDCSTATVGSSENQFGRWSDLPVPHYGCCFFPNAISAVGERLLETAVFQLLVGVQAASTGIRLLDRHLCGGQNTTDATAVVWPPAS